MQKQTKDNDDLMDFNNSSISDYIYSLGNQQDSENENPNDENPDSFIANEELAMQDDAESMNGSISSEIAEMQEEITLLKNTLIDIQDQKDNLTIQLISQSSEIEKLNDIISSLQLDYKKSQDQNAVLSRQIQEQKSLNDELSLKLQKATEKVRSVQNIENDQKNENRDKTSYLNDNQPDQLIYKIRALEVQLASTQAENGNLKKEIENREKSFIEEISRLSQEIANANAPSSIQIKPDLSLEDEIATLRNQIQTMEETQSSIVQSLQSEISKNSQISDELTSTKRNLATALSEKMEILTDIEIAKKVTNSETTADLITAVRSLIAEKTEARQAREQLCQLQIRFNQESLINENLRKELLEAQTKLLTPTFTQEFENTNANNETNENNNSGENNNSNVQNDEALKKNEEIIDEYEDQIRRIKDDYERRLIVERGRTTEQQNVVEELKMRNQIIAEHLLSTDEQTPIILTLAEVFSALANGSYEVELENMIQMAKEYVHQKYLLNAVTMLNGRTKVLSVVLSQIENLTRKMNYISRKVSPFTKNNQKKLNSSIASRSPHQRGSFTRSPNAIPHAKSQGSRIPLAMRHNGIYGISPRNSPSTLHEPRTSFHD
ncbi:hypothetical protein TRFO_13011 [Tritrichomonas foetus]|uniref:Uncharacterized protein n=1 Tax=Tritrichomonas foetus TaxID=1144522 RepID=A0A1J4KZR2_9EUKA|nr:hypothetical protein TRFO_13011 [Tritrichomonas foetus]|eukprot:OHT16739.1 hypothetical protein TRFO_13011 [Tritrichomonas foetus]